ncbi:MAG: hypothetical protein ABJF10_17115 [Chthoniobacter sp.]|uniref:hypothetical protein n=1 Tax=Chthoniobacter sp. TaxID=2510640 RepID=UPI0032A843FE
MTTDESHSARNGKIAHFPTAIRHKLNERLATGKRRRFVRSLTGKPGGFRYEWRAWNGWHQSSRIKVNQGAKKLASLPGDPRPAADANQGAPAKEQPI